MRRFLLGAAIGAAALLVPVSGVAGAAGTHGSATHFSTTHSEFPNLTTQWSCTGNRIVNNGAGTKDTESCLLTGDVSGIVPGTYKSDPSLGLGTSGVCTGGAMGVVPFLFDPPHHVCWVSDYDGQLASKWSDTWVLNLDGTVTFSLVAYYNN